MADRKRLYESFGSGPDTVSPLKTNTVKGSARFGQQYSTETNGGTTYHVYYNGGKRQVVRVAGKPKDMGAYMRKRFGGSAQSRSFDSTA